MIHYLLLFQFALLYWITVVMGLIVYGSDFDSITGKLYLIPMVVVPLLHRFKGRFAPFIATGFPATVILLSGALLAWVAYQPLHFNYWDEHNLRQAVLLAILGVVSYLASVIASVRLQAWQGNHRHAMVIAWLVLGIAWLPAVGYPMFTLLVMALIMAVAGLWPVKVEPAPATNGDTAFKAAGLRYLMFLLAMDTSLIIWDYQVNSHWAWHLAGIFIAAALGNWLALQSPVRLFVPMVAVVVVNFVAAILWPAFVISPLHSALIGLPMGWVTGRLLQGQVRFNSGARVGMSLPLFLGLVLGYLFYANLAYEAWRALLLVPLLAILLRNAAGSFRSVSA